MALTFILPEQMLQMALLLPQDNNYMCFEVLQAVNQAHPTFGQGRGVVGGGGVVWAGGWGWGGAGGDLPSPLMLFFL